MAPPMIFALIRPKPDSASNDRRGTARGPAELEVESYALLEGGYWYAVIKFIRGGKQLGEDTVLREVPCRTVQGALNLGREYAAMADAPNRSFFPWRETREPSTVRVDKRHPSPHDSAGREPAQAQPSRRRHEG